MPLHRRALALLVVLGVLGVMTILALAFVSLAQLERRASQQRTNASKAFFLARSGLEDALARLGMGQDPYFAPSRYAGEDWNANGVRDGIEIPAETYRRGILDLEGCPVPQALRPSFAAQNAIGPLLRPVDGRLRGYTGILAGDSAPKGNAWTVKVSSGGFHVNGGDSAQGPAVGYNATLRRMMGILAREIGAPLAQADGWNLLDLRPASGWSSFTQIRDRALGGSQAKLDVLKPYLSLKAWTDRHVIAPNVTDGTGGTLNMVDRPYSCWGNARGERLNPVNPASRAPDFERMPPTALGRVVGRAPVDLAWARTRRPAMMALLEGLKGLYFYEGTAAINLDTASYTYETAPQHWTVYAPVTGNDQGGSLRAVTVSNAWAVALLPLFQNPATDLSTWQKFNAFCDTLPFAGTVTLDPSTWAPVPDLQALRDLIKANFNPNSDLNKFNPCKGMWKLVDKSDLLVYSTEFSLAPVNPRQLESLGVVLDASGRILAQRRIQATAGPGVVRLSTQKELVSEDLGSLEYAGDERAPRLPGFDVGGLPAFLTESAGIDKTWGHRLDTRARYPLGWMDGDCGGVSLQTYPEPVVNPGGGLAVAPADYAGGLQLATIETAKDAFYTVPVVAGLPQMNLLARFDDGFDLDDWDAAYANGNLCLPGSRQVTTAELGLSVWCANAGSKLNTLYPDGAYSEVRRVPSYYDKGNCHGFHGALSLWVKTIYNLPFHGPGGAPASARRTHPFVMRSAPASPDQQFFFLGDKHDSIGTPGGQGLGMQFELGKNVDDQDNTLEICQEDRLTAGWASPHTWQLVTATWDFLSTVRDDTGRFIVDGGGGQNPGAMGSTNYYVSQYGAWPSAAADITADNAGNLHRFALGAQGEQIPNRATWEYAGITPAADATLDELAIYDFGGAPAGGGIVPPDALLAAETLATSRYQAGRYYKGSGQAPGAGGAFTTDPGPAWVSAPIRLPPGSVLQELRWTWNSPAALPSDYAEVETLKTDLSGWLGTEAASRSVLASGWAAPPAGAVQSWKVGGVLSGPFRARVTFRRNVPGSITADTPILESPVLDDLTILYLPPGGMSLLAYGEE